MKKIFFFFFLLVLAIVVGGGTGAYLAITGELPQIEDLKGYRTFPGTKVYSGDDQLIGEFKVEKGIFVSFDHFPAFLVNAVIATEDEHFWTHSGIDVKAIARALYKDIRAGGFKEGASTITQQLSKNLFLSPEKKIRRKLQELALAMKIERALSKEQIFELYLNKVYFGHGAYGIEMAARTYFNKNVEELTLAESSVLAGLIKAPNRYSPIRKPDLSRQRQRVVLGRMVETGFITRAEADAAVAAPLELTMGKRRSQSNYFLEYLRKELETEYGTDRIYGDGLRVYSTINRRMQKAAEKAVRQGLRDIDKRRGWRGPLSTRTADEPPLWETQPPVKEIPDDELIPAEITEVTDDIIKVRGPGFSGWIDTEDAKWTGRIRNPDGELRWEQYRPRKMFRPGMRVEVLLKHRVENRYGYRFTLEQTPEVQAALVCIDPATGYILAMVGGYDFNQSEFNRAVAARRQPGSGFKPVLYASAMAQGFTPADLLMDEEIEYTSDVWGDWKPGNYDRRYYGPTSLRDALTYSRNVISIKLLEFVGINKLISTARAMGFEGPFPRDLTLALGSLSASPLEVVSAYSTLPQGGTHLPPTPVRYVLDSAGRLAGESSEKPTRALDPADAFLVTSMMEDVVRRGTGWRAKAVGRPVAGKTGTTNEYRDAWFIGFTPNLVAGVWVGLDDMEPIGPKETGSRAAAPIWVDFMKQAVRNLPVLNFAIPPDISTAIIDADTGLLATSDTPRRMAEYFRDGSEPTEYTSSDIRLEILKLKVPMEAQPEFD